MQNNKNQYTEDIEDSHEALKMHFNSQMKEKDEEILKLKAQLSETHQYLNDFAYASAHALKSPVANLNLVTILLEKSNDIEEFKSYLLTIKNSIKKLDQTIHGMVLGFQVKAIDDVPALVSISEIIDSVLMKNQGQLNCRTANINVNLGSCHEIWYSKNILSDILNILLVNSLYYKAENRDLQIDIRAERCGDMVVLEIADNGTGIDIARHRKDLFQPFKKFSPISQGNGIGLYLAKTLIEKNNGKIEIDSKPNQGTVVKCYLVEQKKV